MHIRFARVGTYYTQEIIFKPSNMYQRDKSTFFDRLCYGHYFFSVSTLILFEQQGKIKEIIATPLGRNFGVSIAYATEKFNHSTAIKIAICFKECHGSEPDRRWNIFWVPCCIWQCAGRSLCSIFLHLSTAYWGCTRVLMHMV